MQQQTNNSNIHVLCIEDDAIAGYVYKKNLTKAGFKVDVALDGGQGIQAFEKGNYQAVVVDYMMPVYNGLDVLRILSAKENCPPIIMMTGAGTEKIAVEALKLGAYDYIVKDEVCGQLLPSIVTKAIREYSLTHEKTQALRALKQSEQRLNLIFNQSFQMMVLLSPEGKIIQANYAALSFKNLFADKIKGTFFHNSAWFDIGENTQQQIHTAIKAAAKGKFQQLELELLSHEAEIVTLDCALTPAFDADTNVTDIIFEGHDISIRKQLEQAKAEFLGNISHELLTPLNAIKGYTEILQEELIDQLSETDLNSLKHINMAGNILYEKILDLLQIAKLETHKVTLNNQRFSLRPLIEAIIDKEKSAAIDKKIELNYQLPHELPKSFIGDEDKIRQVLGHLISNAIKFTNQGSANLSLTILEQNTSGVLFRFAVSDTGIGVAQEIRSKIFQPFQQGDGSINRQYNGIGIGLSICKKLIDLLGGELAMDSEPGKGCTFWFNLWLSKERLA